jgi:Putative prokaryotic signal transducing protein
MYCPQCRAEWVSGITRCPDCDVELVDELPAKPARDETTDDLVTVFSSHDPGLVAIAESLLQSAEIGVSLRGDLSPYPGALPVDLQVLASDAADARLILAELSGPES